MRIVEILRKSVLENPCDLEAVHLYATLSLLSVAYKEF